ncbi:MAG TPA: molecular chaperone HtpG [Methylocystis sp.]|nr:molecular chaperone HtpG [Methylocystis sp.]
MTDEAASATQEQKAPASSHGFTADVARLLQLMAHSVYSERDVFLRELVSNAADACEKLRYESLSNEALAAQAGPPLVTISLDKDKRLLTVADNGVGMSRDELVSALGTIASSGTRAFLESIEQDKRAGIGESLIGQFGVGFYSAFMVADRVEVTTRRAGADEAWLWTSDGQGTYEISAVPLEGAPPVGTRVALHLNAESDEFLDSWRVERALKEHSGAIAIPVEVIGAPGEEPRRVADGQAIWAKPKSEIKTEEYTDFYRQLAGQFDEPALTLHWRAEGRTEFTVLAFIPGARPFDLFDPVRKSKSKLYVRRVLIAKEIELLPAWLRFVRLVVDSADIPLNVSREMAQQSPIIAQIGKAVTTRVMQELTKLAQDDPEKFATVWDHFGAVIKEGLHEDPQRRDEIFKIARFASTKAPEKKRTLADYVADLRENQTAIFYSVGDDRNRLAQSPHIEEFAARGVEVLLLDDAVDAFWVTSCVGFEGKPFKSVTQGAADISLVPPLEGKERPADDEHGAEAAALVAAMKEALKDHVEDVRVSTRLRESAVCLIAPEFGLDRRLQRLLAEHGQSGGLGKPVLEINPRHAAVAALFGAAQDDKTRDAYFLLLDLARIADGEPPIDPAAFAKRFTARLAPSGAAA